MREKLFLAGHKGLVGSAVYRKLSNSQKYDVIVADRQKLDLFDQKAVYQFIHQTKPDVIIDAAAHVGGIKANMEKKADFILKNLLIQNNLINGALEAKVNKFVFLGSSCVYPKYANQPIHESSLLSSDLEPTNDAYAVAKIAGIYSCRAIFEQYGLSYTSLMPTNVYGPYDNFDLDTAHVLPALIRKFDEAKKNNADIVALWGTGKPCREFIFSEDLAEAILFCAENYHEKEIINVGTGKDISIRDLAELTAKITGYRGSIEFNTDMPDGTPKKLLDVSKINTLGWAAKTSLEEGIKLTYEAYSAGHVK